MPLVATLASLGEDEELVRSAVVPPATDSIERRRIVDVVAAVATVSGPAADLFAITDVSGDDIGGWLREFHGYRGVFVLVDPAERTSRVITFWETAHDERAAREGRGAMRDQLMALVGLEVVSFDVYDVAGHEYLPAAG